MPLETSARLRALCTSVRLGGILERHLVDDGCARGTELGYTVLGDEVV
ncbi:MAG: hypothetical protein QM626_04590 [Microbacterium sp.]